MSLMPYTLTCSLMIILTLVSAGTIDKTHRRVIMKCIYISTQETSQENFQVLISKGLFHANASHFLASLVHLE